MEAPSSTPPSPSSGWGRIRELALEALDREPAERGAFLDSACGGDAALRTEVRRLLESFEAAERQEFLEIPAVGGAAVAGMAELGALVGTRLGRYRVRRLIGVGGMGAVYEAVQDQPRRTVALKVMRLGLASASALRRFEYESQLLARLRHPGIAQVFEAGAHELPGGGAVPYFAMEYIAGARPITEHARVQGLSVHKRLELMARVCEAVHHGHQRGIVHRDLKPTNILVDSSGSPKIIDFGVARATDSDLALTTLRTDVGQLVGTLQYMSPEQCAADPMDIDTRSDVYSLGVVLYELLTGRAPYDVSTVPVFEAPRIIREQSPQRPSAIDASLRGDVQIIVLKALEKDREQRYQSAAELALDLRRSLGGEAIAARPPSVIYQVRVFARRHRTLVWSVAAVLLALVAGVIVAGVGMSRAITARDDAHRAELEARAQATRAERIAAFLRGTIGSASPALASVTPHGGPPGADPEYTPWEYQRGSAWEYAGRPGQPPSAVDLLITAGRRIDEIFADDPSIRAELAYLVGTTLSGMGHFADAKPLLATAAELQRNRLGPDHESTIAALLALGAVQSLTGEGPAAEETLRSAHESSRRAFGPADPRTLQVGRQRTDNLASIVGRQREALEMQRGAIALLAHVLGPDEVRTLIEVSHLGFLLEGAGQPDEAVAEGRRAVRGLKERAGPDRRPTADAMYILAHALRTRGGPGALTEAEQLQRSALACYRDRISPDHNGTIEIAKGEVELLLLLGRFAEAEPVARQILESQQRVYGKESINVLKAEARLARVLIAAGLKLDEAEALARDAAQRTPAVTNIVEDYAVYHSATCTDARRARGAPAEALRECERLLALTGDSAAHNSPWVMAYVRGVQGQCLSDLGRLDEALVVLEAALADADRWADPASAIRAGVVRAGIHVCELRNDAGAGAAWRARLPQP